MVICSKCGATYGDKYNYCPFCGEKTNSMNACVNCGAELPAGSAFCNRCGAAQQGTLPVAQPAQASSQASDIDRIKAMIPALREMLSAQAQEKPLSKKEMKALKKQAKLKEKISKSEKKNTVAETTVAPQPAPVQQSVPVQQPAQQYAPQYVQQPVVQPIVQPVYTPYPVPVVNPYQQQYDQSGAAQMQNGNTSKRNKNANNVQPQYAYQPAPAYAKPRVKKHRFAAFMMFLFTAAFIACLCLDFYIKDATTAFKGYEVLGALAHMIPTVGDMIPETAGMTAFTDVLATAQSSGMATYVCYLIVAGSLALISLIILIDFIACIVRIIGGKAKRGEHQLIFICLILEIFFVLALFVAQIIGNFSNFAAIAIDFFTMKYETTFGIYFLAGLGALLLRFITPFFISKKGYQR